MGVTHLQGDGRYIGENVTRTFRKGAKRYVAEGEISENVT